MPDITVQDAIRQEAKKAGIPEAFALAVAEQESGFNPGATSPKGALGVMQLMPETAKKYKVDPNNPIENIRGGVQHLRYLLDKYQGDPEKSLAAYNAGEGIIGKDLPAETKAYVPGVLDRMKKFTQSAQTPDKMSATIDPKTRGQVPPPPPKKEADKPLDLTKLPQHMVETSIAGAKRAAGGAVQTITGVGEGGRERGVRDLLEGSLEASTPVTLPLAVLSAVVNPLETLSALAVSAGGGFTAEALAKKLGASEDTSALFGDFAGFLAPEMGGRATTLAGKAFIPSEAAVKEAADLARINAEHNLHLSGPELSPKGVVGSIKRQAQRGMASTLTGGGIQAGYRAQGETNALQAMDAAVRALAEPASKEGAGRAAEEGLLAARAGQDVLGKKVQEAKELAGPVDIANNTKSGRLGAQAEIERIFAEEILPDLLDHPAAGRTPAAVSAIKRFVQNNSPIWEPAQVGGGRTLTAEAKKIFQLLPTGTKDVPFAPFTEEMKALYFGKPIRTFSGIRKSRKQFLNVVKSNAKDYVGDEKTGLARHLVGILTEHLHDTSPEYAAASVPFKEANKIIGRNKENTPLMTKMLKEISLKPSSAVNYLSQGPEYARNFRKALLGVAAEGPQKGAAEAAYSVVQATWWQNKILYNAKGKPDLAGMADRIQKNGPVLKELYSDPKGQRLVQTGTDIAKAIQAHGPAFQRSLYLVMMTSSILAGRGPGLYLRAETATGFLTWLMYNPKAANYFVEGMKAGPEAFQKTIPGLRRIGQAYAAHLGVVQAQQLQAAKLAKEQKEAERKAAAVQ